MPLTTANNGTPLPALRRHTVIEALMQLVAGTRWDWGNRLLGLKPRSFQEPSTTSVGCGRDHEAGLRPVKLD